MPPKCSLSRSRTEILPTTPPRSPSVRVGASTVQPDDPFASRLVTRSVAL
jgi:hypothetical protein